MNQAAIGRVVHYFPEAPYVPVMPNASDPFGRRAGRESRKQPYAATIVFVFPSGLINVAGWDHDGKPFAALEVELIEAHEDAPAYKRYASWPQRGSSAGESGSTGPQTPFPSLDVGQGSLDDLIRHANECIAKSHTVPASFFTPVDLSPAKDEISFEQPVAKNLITHVITERIMMKLTKPGSEIMLKAFGP